MPDHADPAVLIERDEQDPAVAVLTLNRPTRYNALTVELKTALLDAVTTLASEDGVRALVITGAGKAFCVGQDLGEHAETLRADAASSFDTVTEHYNPIVLGLADLPFPVVAAINGPCVGAGLGFAMACDLRIAAAGLKFTTAFVGIGLTADSGLSASLAHAVGVSRATELLMLNETFTAEDALGWGLVRAVVPAEEVLPAALELARKLATGPTLAYAEVKRAVRNGAVSDLPAVLAEEGAAQARLATTEDHRSRRRRLPQQAPPDLPGSMTAGARTRRPSHGPGSLLEVAVAEFITRGYDATSMEDLSRAAGITKSSFYHHFTGKEALLRAALERALDRLFAILDEPAAVTGTPLARLRHIVSGQVAVLVDDLPYVTLLLRVRGNTETERWALDRRRTFDAQIAALVREAVDAGEVRVGVEPALAARLLSGLVNSVVEWARPEHGTATLPADVARAAFEGILPPPARDRPARQISASWPVPCLT